MRVKITALTESPATIPFNYNYALHSAIYGLIEKSSGEYSKYLHDKGFINETVKKRFKLFTFSKLFFTPTKIQKTGFSKVKEISFIFSTPIEQSYEHLILGLFSDQTFYLNFSGKGKSQQIWKKEISITQRPLLSHYYLTAYKRLQGRRKSVNQLTCGYEST